MKKWWYSHGDQRRGPISIEELSTLIHTGQVTFETLLWQAGMTAWKPLTDIEELSGMRAATPPPLPAKRRAPSSAATPANRWTRFFARVFDCVWEVNLVAFVAAFAIGAYSEAFVEWIDNRASELLFGVACLPIALLLDAVVYAIAGNTPGKALLRIRVVTQTGEAPNFSQYVARNMALWPEGLGLGLPLINLVTMAAQAGRLGKGKEASYDEGEGRVVQTASSLLAKTAFAAHSPSWFYA